MKVVHVVGTRPNFVKIAAVLEEMNHYPKDFEQLLVHTGQHYDERMSRIFFEDLRIPRPDLNLEVGSGSHAVQTARAMMAFEPVLNANRPDLVIVVGDVNSTLACSLVAAKMHVPVAHIEAGLRSFDRDMPEEINRVLTDRIAEFLFTTEEDANWNLSREGVSSDRIHFVGNVMIDTLLRHRDRASMTNTVAQYGLCDQGFAVLTLHRPSNVDEPAVLSSILAALDVIQEHLPVIFPVHPRTSSKLDEFGLWERLACMTNVRVTEPLGYLAFLDLMANSRLVLTDSGGIQEETTILGVPCLTLRERTERPVTVTKGTNVLVAHNTERIIAEFRAVCEGRARAAETPALWDGQASTRIVDVLRRAW